MKNVLVNEFLYVTDSCDNGHCEKSTFGEGPVEVPPSDRAIVSVVLYSLQNATLQERQICYHLINQSIL